MMQNDKVQKWVDSIPVQNGDDDVHDISASEDGLHVNNGKAGDDLTLGAEAKCVLLNADETEGGNGQRQEKNTEMILNGVEGSTALHPPGARCGNGGAAAMLRQRFQVQQQDSFNSEASSYLTIDSLDQLLLERRGDPEKILENLGFVGKFVNRFQRIPDRFLGTPSNAHGISVEKFVDENPWLKEYLGQKAAMQKPYEAIAEDREDKVPAEAGLLAGKKLTAFHEVASTVAMITRFRNLVRRINNRDAPEPDVALVEPIMRNSTRGTKYWSILSMDNCAFLEQMGYYDMQLDKLSKMKENSGKFFVAARLMKSQLSGGNGLKPATQEPVATGHPELDLRSKQTEKLDKILRSRAPEPSNEKSEKTGERPDLSMSKDTRFCVPQRFLSSQSQLFGSVQPMTGESISEIVRRTSESNFDFTSISELHHFPSVSESPDQTLKDINANSLHVDLPVIEINLFREHRSSSASTNDDSFEYEWQRTSMSSAATEDSSGSEVDDRFACFRDSFDLPGLSLDDLGPPSLKVPSDALSVISSHTLQDNDNTDHASDQDTYTDALQMSQDSESLRVGESGVIQFNSSEQTDDQLAVDHRDGCGQSDEKDISNDSLPRVVTFSSKIKGVLRRQGSSQSDSSGFAESDHVDAADSTSLNKVRYINRMMKLDAISSQDSTSMDEDSAFQLQSDYSDTQQSLVKSANHDLDSDMPHRLRILTGDFRNEFWSTKRSIQTQTDWISSVNSPEDRKTSQERCSSVSLKDMFLSQPEIYTTRLYIDSMLPKTSIPLVERTEVMLIVDGSDGEMVKKNDQTRCGSRFSSVNIEVVNTEDGLQHLTPVSFSSGESSTVRWSETASEQFCPVHKKRRRLSLDCDSISNVIPPLSREFTHPVDTDDVRHCRRLSLDSTDHQILHSLLKQSVFISPQSAANLLPPSHWSTFGHSDMGLKQHLVEEVKLLQHALQKYRLEMKVLQMQAKKLYMEEAEDCLLPEERNGLIMMEELRDAISKELDNLDTQLSQRMKLVISVAPDNRSTAVDLSCISVVQQMTELLKEQIYHSNIITGMSTTLPSRHCLSSETASSDARTAGDNLLLERIASLEKKMEEQSRTVEVFLSGALKQIQETMQQELLCQAAVTPASSPDKSV